MCLQRPRVHEAVCLIIICTVYVCMLCDSMCVCLWPATPVHLKLFGCRQARSARSRLLHLVNPPLLCLLLRLSVYECLLSVCECAWLLLSRALMWIPTHAQMRALSLGYATCHNYLSTYPLYTHTHTCTNTQQLNRYYEINQYSINLPFLIFSLVLAW